MTDQARAARKRELDIEVMRREFDQSFSREPSVGDAASESILLIRAGTRNFVVRGNEITGVAPAGKISRVPSRTAALLGVTGIRGALVPVFALATLLGESGVDEAAPWLLLFDRERPLALAFHGIVGFRKIGMGERSPMLDSPHESEALRQVVAWGADVVPVVHMPSLVAGVRQRAARERSRKEGE